MSRQIYDGKIHIFYFCVTRALYKCFVRCKKLRENFYRSYDTCLAYLGKHILRLDFIV